MAEHAKPDEVIEAIRTVIKDCFLFAHLDDAALRRTALARFKVRESPLVRCRERGLSTDCRCRVEPRRHRAAARCDAAVDWGWVWSWWPVVVQLI